MGRGLSERRKYKTRGQKRILRIFCEGKETEPLYFTSIIRELRLSNVRPKGTGYNTISLVKFAISQMESAEEVDECWVVFDKDDYEDFNKAIEYAEAHGVNVAYSNESFELWFILHFIYLQTALGRDKFKNKLTKLLGTEYEKNMDVYSLIKGNEATAITNAKKLEKMHDDNGEASPQKRDPSTTVFKLVERLRELGS